MERWRGRGGRDVLGLQDDDWPMRGEEACINVLLYARDARQINVRGDVT